MSPTCVLSQKHGGAVLLTDEFKKRDTIFQGADRVV